jgi:hypothetical protein
MQDNNVFRRFNTYGIYLLSAWVVGSIWLNLAMLA